jgi:Tripartite tricarboxylate transporter TctB family
MLTSDRLSGGALVLFALFVIFESRSLPLGTFRQPGPAFIPILFALLLLLFSAAVMLTSGRAGLHSQIRRDEWRHVLAILAVSVFPVFALERLGYRLTVALMLVFLLQIVERRGWIVSLAFALILASGSFFLFHNILRVPLPEGPLGF